MANRYPLIIDTADGNRIKELPNGDSLNLTGNAIVGVSNISATGALSVSSVAVEGSIVVGSNVLATANITAADFLIDGVSVLNSVDYGDLLNAPVLADVATSGDYLDLLNTPVLAPVATSGSYTDLLNTPLIPTDIGQLTDNGGLLSGGAFTDLSDTPDEYTGFANRFVQVNATEDGLQFVTVSTTITDGDVIDALGYIPYDSANPDAYINSSSGITGALGYTPYNGDTNPNSYISGSVGIIDALGYIPYDSANPDGYLTGITDVQVTTALGYTPYNGDTNPDGYISDSAGVVSALGYTPYNGDTNPNGYLTAEADTLESVTGRGTTSTSTITAAGFTTAGDVSAANVTISSAITFTSTGTISLNGGAGSTVVLGGTSNISLRDASGSIDVQAGMVPNIGASYDIGSSGSPFANGYFSSQVEASDFATNAASSNFNLQGSLSIVPGAATNFVRVTTGVFGVPSITTTARDALTPQYGDIIHNTTDGIPQMYVRAATEDGSDAWMDLALAFKDTEPASPYNGQMVIASGGNWDPAGTGTQTLVIRLNSAWITIASGA